MNKKDKERLLELSLRVWAHAAKHHMLHNTEALLQRNDIESHDGRIDKALRLLLEANVIRKLQSKVYEVVNLEDAKEHAVPPEFEKPHNWRAYIGHSMSDGNITYTGYKWLNKDMPDAAKLYVYFHQEEYLMRSFPGENASIEIYPKAYNDQRIKMVLKCLVETSLKNELPGYVQILTGAQTARPCKIASFEYPKYILSALQDEEKVHEILQQYEANRNEIRKRYEAFCVMREFVGRAGSYEEVVRQLRRQVIDELTGGMPLFAESLRNPLTDPHAAGRDDYFIRSEKHIPANRNENMTGVLFTVKNKHLCSYDQLYSEEMGGEDVIDVSVSSWNSSTTAGSLNLKEVFGERKIQTEAA